MYFCACSCISLIRIGLNSYRIEINYFTGCLQLKWSLIRIEINYVLESMYCHS